MLLEKAIESAVIAKINSLALASAWITGGWQSAAVGDTKTEPANALCVINVNAKPRAYETFETPACEVQVDMDISIRDELAPTGAEVAAYCEPIFNLLQSWQMSLSAAVTDLPVSGFRVCGVRIDGGDTARDESSSRSVITQAVTIKGVISTNQ